MEQFNTAFQELVTPRGTDISPEEKLELAIKSRYTAANTNSKKLGSGPKVY